MIIKPLQITYMTCPHPPSAIVAMHRIAKVGPPTRVNRIGYGGRVAKVSTTLRDQVRWPFLRGTRRVILVYKAKETT